MSDAVERMVSSARAGLNARLSMARALDWAWKAALGGAAAILPLRFLGLGWEGVALWLFLVATAAFSGFLRSRSARLGSGAAARWLDERFGNGELLSAAMVCKDREASGRFDAEILESANAFASSAEPPRIPARAFAVKSAWVAGLCLACLAVLSLAGPARAGKAKGLSLLDDPESAASSLKEMAIKPDSFQGREAREMAYRLFPKDKRMASLAEKALRDGRIEDLRKLLDRAEKEYAKRVLVAKSELERQELEEQLSMFKDAARRGLGNGGEYQNAPGEGDAPSKKDGPQAKDGSEGDATDRDPGTGAAGDGEMEDGAAGAGQDGFEPGGSEEGAGGGVRVDEGAFDGAGGKSDRGSKAEGSAEGLKGGAAAGFGAAQGTLKLDGRGGSDAGKRTLDIGRSDDDKQMREMILPESEAVGSGSRPVFDASRSGESAAARKDLPLEYRDYTRSYFMRLTEGEGNEGR